MGESKIVAGLGFATVVVVILLVVVAIDAARGADLPNSSLTPGANNPAVTQANIGSTICVAGWSARQRPPAAYTNALKRSQIADPLYGVTDKNPRDCEEDHLKSIELGGAPRDKKNLWCQSYSGTWNAHVKDRLENTLHRLVCAKKISLAAAQKAIATNWIAAYKKFVGSKP